MKRADYIIADSLGWDIKEVQECRYQKYTNPAVYSIGEYYFAVSKTQPKHKDVGENWVEYKDQFGARNTDKKIWVCNQIKENK